MWSNGKNLSERSRLSTFAAKDSDFNAVLVCAIRYCLGRKTYMPSVVTEFIWPLLPYLQQQTPAIIQRDIKGATSYGDDAIDKPIWMWFLYEIDAELQRRNRKNDS